MKNNKTHRPARTNRTTRLRMAQTTPPMPARPRPGCEFLDFCLYPGMNTEFARPQYPTAV